MGDLRLWCFAGVMAALAAAGCAQVPIGTAPAASGTLAQAGAAQAAPITHDEALLLDPAAGRFGPPSTAIGTAGLFDMDDAMREFARTVLARAIHQAGREQGLVDALYRRDALQLHYDPTRTRSAAETFAARRGNCLSLVIMTAAFARHLGLAVDFRAAQIDPSWSRRGGLSLASGHVNITIGRRMGERLRDGFGASARLTVDFLPAEELLGLRTRPITEDELQAMFLNNRAAEALADGLLDDAHAWAAAAVVAAPRQASAWNTLGAVFRRHGDTALAVRAFRAALARAPQHLPAMANLAQALAAAGQADESAVWASRLAALEADPPFADLVRGWDAVARRDWQAARRHFLRELRRSGPAVDLHHGLALAAQHLSEPDEVRRQLAAALAASTEEGERLRFHAKLDTLGQGARCPRRASSAPRRAVMPAFRRCWPSGCPCAPCRPASRPG